MAAGIQFLNQALFFIRHSQYFEYQLQAREPQYLLLVSTERVFRFHH